MKVFNRYSKVAAKTAKCQLLPKIQIFPFATVSLKSKPINSELEDENTQPNLPLQPLWMPGVYANKVQTLLFVIPNYMLSQMLGSYSNSSMKLRLPKKEEEKIICRWAIN